MTIDWRQCTLVQRDPEYQSGAATLCSDPRMTVDTLVECSDDGMEAAEIAEAYRVPVQIVRQLLEYASACRALSAPGS